MAVCKTRVQKYFFFGYKCLSPAAARKKKTAETGGRTVLCIGILQTFASMKKRYVYPDGEMVQADVTELRRLLAQQREYLRNYEELRSCLDDADYVARGNGFCEAKYSEDFVEQQVEKYRLRTEAIAQWIKANETCRR